MKKINNIIYAFVFFASISIALSQGPMGRNFGFGIMFGDPTGATLKFWTNRENALVVDVGSSYFGNVRFNVDYLWHFDAFHSNVVKLYAGPGGVIGIGEGRGYWFGHGHDDFYYRDGGGTGIGVRGIFGVNIIPRRTPLEIFLEVGVLLGVSPAFGTGIDTGLGIRFYP
jgi:hypothetical protein